MGVFNGGIGAFAEDAMLAAYFGNAGLVIPATVYVGLALSSPIDIANVGPTVTYGASSLTDTATKFTSLNLAGAFVISSTGKTGTVLSNTNDTITLVAPWGGGTPAAGERYYVNVYNEPNGNGYARVAITNNGAAWTSLPSPFQAGSLRELEAASNIDFPAATGAGWGTVTFALLADAATEGHLLNAQRIQIPQNISNGVSPAIAPGTYTVGLR